MPPTPGNSSVDPAGFVGAFAVVFVLFAVIIAAGIVFAIVTAVRRSASGEPAAPITPQQQRQGDSLNLSMQQQMLQQQLMNDQTQQLIQQQQQQQIIQQQNQINGL